MRRVAYIFPTVLAFISVCTVVNAQDSGQRGVTYYGVPAAKKLYQQPQSVAAPVSGKQRRRTASDRNAILGVAGVSDQKIRLTSQGYDRNFSVHVPPNYDPRHPPPVLLMFHGLGMSGAMMAPLTGMNAAADRNGYVVVYPDGLGKRWNDGLQSSQVNDVAFVQDMLAALSQSVIYDHSRVYAVGLSNGGFFSQKLACDLAGTIAGVAVVAASGNEAVCASCHGNSVPIIFFLGTDDPLVPRPGSSKSLGKLGEMVGLGGLDTLGGGIGKLAGLMDATEIVDFWVRHNGAGANPYRQVLPDTSRGDGCKVTRETYGSGRREVAVYTVEGGGHSWPGGLPVASGIVGRTTGDINASELICAFFRNR